MLWVLSWYEDLDTDILTSQRSGSRWEKDPKHIQIRQKIAYEMVRWANTRDYIDGPNASDNEVEEEEEAADSENEYADEEEVGSSDKGTESDPEAANTSKSGSRPDSGAAETGSEAATARLSHDEAIKLAADIGAEAATEASSLIPDAPSSPAP